MFDVENSLNMADSKGLYYMPKLGLIYGVIASSDICLNRYINWNKSTKEHFLNSKYHVK